MKPIAFCVFAAVFAGLFGCAVGGVDYSALPVKLPLPPCGSGISENCVLPDKAPVNELKPNVKARPQVGLALSGGGSKSAPFAMGVIKRFVDEGWVFRTDYLTSVSGGGYSALYLYYAAWEVATGAEQQDPRVPDLRKFFVDARDLADNPTIAAYNVTFHTEDALKPPPVGHVYSLAEYETGQRGDGCYGLTSPPTAGDPKPGRSIGEEVGLNKYQGWVECYQDLLRSGRAPISTYYASTEQLGGTFTMLLDESLIALPVHTVFNLIFDWRKRLSPTQYDYLYGILRTYTFQPAQGEQLPVSLYDPRFKKMADTFKFSDLAVIYTPESAAKIGGLLPKWILQATANSGNVAFDLSSKPYELGQAVFEITFDEFGSGRYGYVKGSPSIVGLTVPLAVLSSAAYADTAQRSLKYPRWAVNGLLNAIDLRWGLDIPNFNSSNFHRVAHSFLPVPFYYFDDSQYGATGPTIHLSDGGQSGDNLGLVSMFRRGVQNIIVAAGEQDDAGSGDTWRVRLASLCSANWYLVERGYTLNFDGNPSDAVPTPKSYNLSQKCRWDEQQRNIGLPASEMVTPMNWKRRAWHGTVERLPLSETKTLLENHFGHPFEDSDIPFQPAPPDLTAIQVYYLMSAIDQPAWLQETDRWFVPVNPPAKVSPSNSACQGDSCVRSPEEGRACKVPCCEGASKLDGQPYSCSLIAYVFALKTARDKEGHTWKFPQTNTAFTTYSNSIGLFRGYRDLGWLYAGDLAAYPDLMSLLNAPRTEAIPRGDTTTGGPIPAP